MQIRRRNDTIVLFTCLDHYSHLSVRKIGIRKTSVVDICSQTMVWKYVICGQ